MSGILQGIIRGKSIELESDPGIPDGKLVEVLLRVRLARSAPPSNSEDAGRTTSAGMLVDDEEWDADLEAVLAKRKTSRHREIGG